MKVDIYSWGLVHASVCVEKGLSPIEIEDSVNAQLPAGAHFRWEIKEKAFRTGQSNPCPCDQNPETREHYLLTC